LAVLVSECFLGEGPKKIVSFLKRQRNQKLALQDQMIVPKAQRQAGAIRNEVDERVEYPAASRYELVLSFA
jgi:hypothetical protein